MPRHARIVIPGLPHHVTQRGNNRQNVFFADADRVAYLDVLREQCSRHAARLLAYCLMSNHLHLVLIPEREDSLQRAVGRSNFLYTQSVNRLHGRSGHLWQARFYSCPMEEGHALAACRYVERNPVRAKMRRVPWAYPWSSAKAHVENTDPAQVLDMTAWREYADGLDWREFLLDDGAPGEAEGLRLGSRTGRPLASDTFLSKMESKLGRRLRPLPVGRPRKAQSE